MRKFLLIASAVASLAAAPSHAATVAASLTVSASLQAQCRVKSGEDNQTLSFSYTAFAASDVNQTAPLTITFECTRGLAAPTVVFDNDGATGNKTSDAAAASAVTGKGVVGGLQYEITATRGTTTTGTAASASSIGSAATVPYTITGKIYADQAGTQGGGAATTATSTQARTLTLTY